jgi:hypothetical protein
MRFHLVILALTASLLLPVAAVAADEPDVNCRAFRTGAGISCGGSETIVVPGRSAPERPQASRRAPRQTSSQQADSNKEAYPQLVTRPDGSQCQRTGYRDPTNQVGAQIGRDAADAFAAGVPRCPAQPAPAAQETDPAVFAVRFWRDVPLPQPRPSIAPGWAITGKYAYLETHGERSHTYTSDTPLGPLVLDARGRYYVDWGDGTKDGPYDFEGRPWPEGRITHTYIDVGFYDVVVTEEWSSTWHIGAAQGELSGLHTEGRIPQFRVEQLQVVVTAD